MKQHIHISDIQAFLQCRRAWNWSSNLRQHLTTIQPYEPFYFGTVMHKLLEYWYTNRSLVDGLTYLLEQPQSIGEFIGFGNQLLNHYLTWQTTSKDHFADVNLEFLSCEESFTVSIRNQRGNPSSKFDYSGIVDGMIRHRLDGKLYIHEIKTTRSIDSRLQQLPFEMQPTAYMLAMQEVYNEPIAGVIYTLLRKKLPDDPDVLKNGMLSKNKSIDTTPDHYLACVRQHHPDMSDQAIRTNYGDILQQLLNQPNRFFRRVLVQRSQAELDQMRTILYDVARDMTNKHIALYPSPGYFCGNCLFQQPCIAQSNGQPIDPILAQHYTRNTRLD